MRGLSERGAIRHRRAMTELQKRVVAVRKALVLLGGGGGIGAIRAKLLGGGTTLGRLMVRDTAFFDMLATELGEWGPRLMAEYTRGRDRDWLEGRERAEREQAAEEVVRIYLLMQREMGVAASGFGRMARGETLRQIMRKSAGRATFSIVDDLERCVKYIDKHDVSGAFKIFVDNAES